MIAPFTELTESERLSQYAEADRIIERRRNPRDPGDVWTKARRTLASMYSLVPPTLVEVAEVACDDCENGYIERDLTNSYGDVYRTINVRCSTCDGTQLRTVEILSCCGRTEDDCMCQ